MRVLQGIYTVRGYVISYTAHLTPPKLSRETELTQKIHEIDDSYANNPGLSLPQYQTE